MKEFLCFDLEDNVRFMREVLMQSQLQRWLVVAAEESACQTYQFATVEMEGEAGSSVKKVGGNGWKPLDVGASCWISIVGVEVEE